MKAHRKWRWVVRERCWVLVFVGSEMPARTFYGGWANNSTDGSVCAENFEAVFGFLPPPGIPVKVEFAAKMVTKKGKVKA